MKRLLYLLLLFPFMARAQSVSISTPKYTICGGKFVHFKAVTSGIPAPHYHWFVNNAPLGLDSTGFTSGTLMTGDTILCDITNAVGDTTYAISNKIGMIVEHMPVVAPITGVDSIVCVGTTITLTDMTAGGIWSITDSGYATVTGGMVKGIQGSQYEFGTKEVPDTIIYSLNNSCGSVMTYKIISVAPQPRASLSLYMDKVCVGFYTPYNEPINGSVYSAWGITAPTNSAVYGLKPGIDRIICVDSNYCGSDTTSSSITVIENVNNIRVFPTNNILCMGDEIPITLPFGDYRYTSWIYKEKYLTLDKSKNVFTAVGIGVDTISVWGSDMCGNYADTGYVTILPPGHIVIPDTICVNNATALIDSTPGGKWSISDAAIATIDNAGTLRPRSTGVATISYTTSTCTTKKTIMIDSPIASITGAMAICQGGKLALKDTAKRGVWLSSDSLVATVDTGGVVRSHSVGTAVISYKVSGCFATASVPVQHLDLITPINKKYNACEGSVGTLIAGSSTDGLWSSNDTNIHVFADHKGQFNAFHKGYVTAFYTLQNGCFDSAQIIITNCDHPIAVFPNPAKNEVTIQADNFYFHTLEFMNTAGQAFLKQNINEMFTKVDVTSLPPGNYLIIFYGYSYNQYTAKFLKE